MMKEELSENRTNNEEISEAPPTIETLENSIEISPALEDDLAICVIKPDAFLNRDAIVRKLEESGLYVVSRNTKVLTENFVIGGMYSPEDMPASVVEATKRHLLSGSSEIVLVKGDIKKLLTTVGIKTNPALCDEASIRYMYGDHVPEELGQGLQYYRNAAHRPRDPKEAKKDLKTFGEIL
jgi:nucleoside diphosphate kinase